MYYYDYSSDSDSSEESSPKRAKSCNHRCYDKRNCGHPCCKVPSYSGYQGKCRHRCNDKRNCLHDCCKIGLNWYSSYYEPPRNYQRKPYQKKPKASQQAALKRAAIKAAKEQAAMVQAAMEQAAWEQAAMEQAAREQAAREQAARDQAAREQAARDQAAREQAARELAAIEQAIRELAAREKAEKEKAAREQAARERAAKELAAREKAEREKAEREKAARERAAREQAAREQAARELAEREQAKKEQVEREKILQFLKQLGFDDTTIQKIQKYGVRKVEDFVHFGNRDWDNLALPPFQKNKIINEISKPLIGQVSKDKEIAQIGKELHKAAEVVPNTKGLIKLIPTYVDLTKPQPALQSENSLSKGVCTRVTDVRSINDRGWFTPVYGLSSMPIVSFEDSLELLIENKCVNGLRSYADEAWTYACKYENPPPKLTRDGIAAIHLYTMEWVQKETSLYYILNEKLREQNRDALKYFFPYLKLLLSALENLPSATEKIIYRGMIGDFSQDYKQGEFIIWWGFSSCTTSLQPVNDFTGNGSRTILNIEYINGVKVKEFSSYKAEEEVLLPPGRYLKVESTMRQKDLLIVHLKEYPSGKIDGPFARPFWQWKNEALWEPYDPKTSDIIEKAYTLFQKKQGPHEITVNLGIHKYQINMKDKFQVNLSTHTPRTIRRFDPND